MSENLDLQFYKQENDFINNYLANNHNLRRTYKDFQMLDWYEFKPDAEILTVNLASKNGIEKLCKTAKFVTDIEFSKHFSMKLVNDIENCKNFEIYTCNLQDFYSDKKFDYIIINDILEASSVFFQNPQPEKSLIEHYKNFLKPEGQLIISVKNRFGIDNWGNELSILRNKIPQYLKYYSEKELLKICQETGFEDIDFYYPVPNYYVSREILTKETLNLFDKKDLLFYDYNINILKIIPKIFDINEYNFFTNGFIIILSKYINTEKIIFAKVLYSQVTKVFKNIKDNHTYSKKTLFNKNLIDSYEQTFNFYKNETIRLKEANITNIKYVKCQFENNELIFEFAKGKRLDLIAHELISANNKEGLYNLFKEFKNMVYTLYPDRKLMNFTTKNMENFFGDFSLDNVECVKNTNYSINLSNVFKDGNNYTIIDYDKLCPYYIPINFIVFRSIAAFLLAIKSDEGVLKTLIPEKEINTYVNIMDYYYNRDQKKFLYM